MKCNECGLPQTLCECPTIAVATSAPTTGAQPYTIHNGAKLDTEDFPPLTFPVAGIIPEGFTLLAGSPKSAKSWLALNIALAVAEGRTVLGGIPTEKRHVLYLALEDGHRRLQYRARILMGGAPIPTDFDYALHVPIGETGNLIREWLDSTADPSRTFIIIDTVQKVRPPSRTGSSMYSDDYEFAGNIKRITDEYPGCAILGIHHTRKMGADDFVETVSGSNGLTGAADTIIILHRRRNEDAGTLSLVSRDLDSDGRYALVRAPIGHGWELEGGSLETAAAAAREAVETDNLGDNAKEVLAHICDHPLCSPAEIKLALPHIPRNTIDSIIKRLYESERIAKDGRGKYRCPTPPSGQPDPALTAAMETLLMDFGDTPGATDSDAHATIASILGAGTSIIAETTDPRR